MSKTGILSSFCAKTVLPAVFYMLFPINLRLHLFNFAAGFVIACAGSYQKGLTAIFVLPLLPVQRFFSFFPLGGGGASGPRIPTVLGLPGNVEVSLACLSITLHTGTDSGHLIVSRCFTNVTDLKRKNRHHDKSLNTWAST